MLGPSNELIEYGPLFHMLYKTSAVLSILGSLVVIVTFIAYPQLRRFFARLILYLAVSDLWLCASMLMGNSKGPHYTKCMVQSLLGTFFGLASILWTLAIAESLRRVLVVSDFDLEGKLEWKMHMVAWGLPALALVVGLSLGVFGPAGTYCWVRNTAVGTVVRLLTFYIPLWLAVAYSMWVYWYISRIMQNVLLQQHALGNGELQEGIEEHRKSIQGLLILPLILVFCWAPSSIRRLVEIFVPDLGWTPLDYLCVAAGPLQGALNAVVYGATPAVRDAVFGRLDNSARKLRSVQVRLRSMRPGRRHFQALDEAIGVPEPVCVGRPICEATGTTAMSTN